MRLFAEVITITMEILTTLFGILGKHNMRKYIRATIHTPQLAATQVLSGLQRCTIGINKK